MLSYEILTFRPFIATVSVQRMNDGIHNTYHIVESLYHGYPEEAANLISILSLYDNLIERI